MDNEECSVECVTREEFDKFKADYNNMIARLARQTELDERILVIQSAVKACEKNISGLVSRVNGFPNEIKAVVDMVTQGFETLGKLVSAIIVETPIQSPTPVKRKQETKSGEYDKLPWTQMKNKKGHWCWSDKADDLAQKIYDNGGRLTVDEYDYALYGDLNESSGIPKCISRYPKRD